MEIERIFIRRLYIVLQYNKKREMAGVEGKEEEGNQVDLMLIICNTFYPL